MKHTQTYEELRGSLINEVSSEIQAIEQEIKNNEAAASSAINKAHEYAEHQDSQGAQNLSREASRLKSCLIAGNAKLRELHLKRENIVHGGHPQLAGLSATTMASQNMINHSELKEARFEFMKTLTPEVRAAALRFVNASVNADPLSQPPTLAAMLAEGI